jgi:2-hydroxy-6-oxonona-2,4-dienedioate hydrolase
MTAPAVEEHPSIWSALREVEFRRGFVDAAGVRTRYATAGDDDAPAVVMLHGTGGHWETVARNLGPYGGHFRSIAFDMIGHGFSDRPDHDYEISHHVDHTVAVMDRLGVERAHLLGTSLGSWVAAALALAHPERVGKLVLMSAAGLVASAENMQRIVGTRMAAVEHPDWESIKAMFDHLIADERNRLPDLVSLRQAIYRQPGMVDTMRHTLVLQDMDTRRRNLLTEDQWRSIEHPVLTIASGQDNSEYSNTSRILAELMPDGRVAEMPEVKHWPHFEDAELFNRLSLEFLVGEMDENDT